MIVSLGSSAEGLTLSDSALPILDFQSTKGMEMLEQYDEPGTELVTVPSKELVQSPVYGVTVVRTDLTGFRGLAALVEFRGEYFVVSNTVVPFSGPETLVFPANADGSVASWSDVAGGKGMSPEEALTDLVRNYNDQV